MTGLELLHLSKQYFPVLPHKTKWKQLLKSGNKILNLRTEQKQKNSTMWDGAYLNTVTKNLTMSFGG